MTKRKGHDDVDASERERLLNNWRDERNGAEIGLVDLQFRPREELLSRMHELNAQVYLLADFFSAQKTGK